MYFFPPQKMGKKLIAFLYSRFFIQMSYEQLNNSYYFSILLQF